MLSLLTKGARLCLQIPYYEYALDLILDADTPNEGLTDDQHEVVEGSAELLYGLIHVRYILTSRGMSAMFEKYKNCEFGRCPRVLCGGQPCLPVGTSDVPRSSTVKIFCPKCGDIYYPRSKYQVSYLGKQRFPSCGGLDHSSVPQTCEPLLATVQSVSEHVYPTFLLVLHLC